MLSIKPVGCSTQEVRYYTTLGQEDYYVGGGEPPGVWWGDGAAQLELTGTVTSSEFRHLLAGRSAEGQTRLVQNAGDPNRRSAFDLTWTVPKSVSVVWSQSSFERRLDIEQACERSVLKILKVVQEYCGTTRRGKHGERTEQAGLIAALFRHDTARAVRNEVPDPNLHWHAVVLNAVSRPDGSTGALDARSLFRPNMKMALGALWRAELSLELQKIGLTSHRPFRNEKVTSWFELDCVPKELLELFSKRRQEIVKWMDARGVSGAKASEKAANATKQAKSSCTRDELLAAWQAVGASVGFITDFGDSKSERQKSGTLGIGEIEEITHSICEQNAHFSEITLLRKVAESAQCRGIGIDQIRETVTSAIIESNEIVSLKSVKGVKRLTTRQMLSVERRMLDAVERSKGCGARMPESLLRSRLRDYPTLRPDQARAVEAITRSRDRIVCVAGMAGTGKTYMLGVARDVLETAGLEVLGSALSAKAADGLETGSGISSLHLHPLFNQLESGQQKLRENSVLVVDEAGMIGTVMMERLVALTEAAGAKLILVGDAKQLQAIDAGGPFAAMCDRLGAATLTNITRQRDAWARDAVKEMSAGNAVSALARFQEKGLVIVADDRTQAMETLVADWQKLGTLKDALIFAGTRYETAVLNRLCQEARLTNGELGNQSIDVGNEQLRVGDRVLFRKNNAALLIRNGQMGTVTEVDISGNMIRIELDRGFQVLIDLNIYDHLTLGYAVTTHKGQGQTVESAFVLAGGTMTDRELSYVQTSRSRGATRIYTDFVSAGLDLSELSKRMGISHAKDLAHEYLLEAS